jgi:hypothetical protein
MQFSAGSLKPKPRALEAGYPLIDDVLFDEIPSRCVGNDRWPDQSRLHTPLRQPADCRLPPSRQAVRPLRHQGDDAEIAMLVLAVVAVSVAIVASTS